jgi:hypothetical protein
MHYYTNKFSLQNFTIKKIQNDKHKHDYIINFKKLIWIGCCDYGCFFY